MKRVQTPWIECVGRRWVLRGLFVFSCIASAALTKPVISYNTHEATKTACSEFSDNRIAGLSWTLADCIDVWTAFRDNLSKQLVIRPPHVDIWRTTAYELKRAGTPCLLTSFLNLYSHAHGTGVGSTTMKHFATWIFAKEMGCDWVTPNWVSFSNARTNETALYCHDVSEKGNPEPSSVSIRACVSVNWLAYFNFGVPSTDLPQGIVIKNVTETDIRDAHNLQNLKAEMKIKGPANVPWERLLLMMPSGFVSSHLATAGSWDKEKNEITREVLDEARKNFHQHPRPWYGFKRNVQQLWDGQR